MKFPRFMRFQFQVGNIQSHYKKNFYSQKKNELLYSKVLFYQKKRGIFD